MEDTTHKDENESSPGAKFTCPNDGEVSQNDVIFLCNKCKQEDMVHKNGIYICPSCFTPGENFECMLCGSKEVKMKLLKD